MVKLPNFRSKSFWDYRLDVTHNWSFSQFYIPRNGILTIFIYLIVVLHRFPHCTGHVTMGSWKARGNQYIQLVKVLY